MCEERVLPQVYYEHVNRHALKAVPIGVIHLGRAVLLVTTSTPPLLDLSWSSAFVREAEGYSLSNRCWFDPRYVYILRSIDHIQGKRVLVPFDDAIWSRVVRWRRWRRLFQYRCLCSDRISVVLGPSITFLSDC